MSFFLSLFFYAHKNGFKIHFMFMVLFFVNAVVNPKFWAG